GVDTQGLIEASYVRGFVFVGRFRKQILSLGACFRFFCQIKTKFEFYKCLDVRKRQTELRRTLRGMMQDDVGEFVRDHSSERGFIRQHVEQSTAHNDSSTDDKRFQWRSKQYAAAHPGDVKIVCDQQIVGDSL